MVWWFGGLVAWWLGGLTVSWFDGLVFVVLCFLWLLWFGGLAVWCFWWFGAESLVWWVGGSPFTM